jgi:hypothetical protein
MSVYHFSDDDEAVRKATLLSGLQHDRKLGRLFWRKMVALLSRPIRS